MSEWRRELLDDPRIMDTAFEALQHQHERGARGSEDDRQYGG